MSKLKELESMGGFISTKPVPKEIKFDIDGKEYTASVFVKRLSVGDFESLFINDKEERSRTAKLISEAITLDEGRERIPFQKAYQLHPALAGAMVKAFNEVNESKKASRPATDSSAS